MKRLSTVFTILITGLWTLTQLKAQDQKWEAGFVLSGGVVSMRTSTSVIHFPKKFIGLDEGFTAAYRFTSHISLSSGFFCQIKNQRNDIQLTDHTSKVVGTIGIDTRYYYLSVPLLWRWDFGNKTRFVLNTGGYANYLFQQTVQLKQPGSSQPPFVSNVADITNLDYGAILGLGLSQSLGSRLSITFECRNYFGLSYLVVYGPIIPSYYYLNYHCLMIGINAKLGKSKV